MTHEATLREMAAIRQAVEHGRSGEPWVSQHAAYTRSILAGADALAALRETRETVDDQALLGGGLAGEALREELPVAQELATEIHKLRGMTAPMETK